MKIYFSAAVLVLSVCSVTGCAPFSQPPTAAPADTAPPEETGQTFVYECDGLDFTVHMRADGITLWLPDRPVALPQVRAASGAKYQGEGMTFWSKGDEALVEIDGKRYSGCTGNPQKAVWEDAKLRGVDFRAVGNEPGWHLEIDADERIVFVGDYGQRRVVVPTPAPEIDRTVRTTTYHAQTEAHTLTVVIEAQPCQDTMSDAEPTFPATVTVRLDGERYRGCGRALR